SKRSQTFQLLHQAVQELPLLFVTTAMGSESIGQLTAHGALDYVELEHLPQLPMTVRRVLKEKKLRDELREAKKALRHSQSLYRALTDNPAYGVYRCNAEGDRKSTRLNSSHVAISYAVFRLKKKATRRRPHSKIPSA